MADDSRAELEAAAKAAEGLRYDDLRATRAMIRLARALLTFHKEETWLDSKSEPDPDWKERGARLVRQMEHDAAVAELIPVIDTHVQLIDGQLWISSWDVINSGIRNRLRADDLVKVGVQVFEIQGYDEPRRRYLVQAFSMTLSDEDLERLSAPGA